MIHSEYSNKNLGSALNAIVLCAGLGTRFKPLSEVISKTVLPVAELPIAFGAIRQLLNAGVQTVHCNTFHLAEGVETEIQSALAAHGYGSDRVRFWRESSLLNTGGGISRIVHACISENSLVEDGDFIIISGDICGEIPITQMVSAWTTRPKNATALMVTRPFDSGRKDATWMSKDAGWCVGFGDPSSAPSGLKMRLFSNYQILSGQVLKREQPESISSIDLYYKRLISRGEQIIQIDHDPDLVWHNIGSLEEYKAVNQSDHKPRHSLLGVSIDQIKSSDHQTPKKSPLQPTLKPTLDLILGNLTITKSIPLPKETQYLHSNIESILTQKHRTRLTQIIHWATQQSSVQEVPDIPAQTPDFVFNIGAYSRLLSKSDSFLIFPIELLLQNNHSKSNIYFSIIPESLRL